MKHWPWFSIIASALLVAFWGVHQAWVHLGKEALLGAAVLLVILAVMVCNVLADVFGRP